MSSIQSLNTTNKESSNFWNFTNNITIETVFQGKIFLKSKNAAFKSCELALAQNYLIKIIPNSANKVALLDKKIIEPFTEAIDQTELFGFKISDSEVSQRFYVENREKLYEWLAAFQVLNKNFMRKIKDDRNIQNTMVTSEELQNSKEESDGISLSCLIKNQYKETIPEALSIKNTKQEYLTSVYALTNFSDDFTLLNEIGHGTVGKVYLANNNSTGKQFAVKAINKEDLAKNEMGLENLVNEIKVMRKLNHPNIIKIHDVYECSNHICLILDYVEHDNLFSRIIEKKAFDENTVARFATKLLSVLDYLSSLNIIHRDIKLENILMTSEDNDYDFKLADFGLAAELNENSLTRCGSPGYIAPEILRKLSYDFKADIFSSGVIFYILLSGKMPFSGRNTIEILRKNRDGIVSFQNEIWRHVSKKGIRFIMKLMEPNHKLRPFAKEALGDPWLQRGLNKLDKKLSNKTLAESVNKKMKIGP
ncbi:unnamed protein product [Blepharisma stoltei]|uniref:non-specific serine/threonine protein kinase n=1 Tax=Blepharisma stoltei TaxID=1481888 RepID=A0AAU9JUM6_9CILI|nr:unnamed protein product [Blepharisma stoltei]